MPLGIFRRLKHGKSKEVDFPSPQRATDITRQRPPHHNAATDQQYVFREAGTLEKGSDSSSRQSISRRFDGLRRRIVSNPTDQPRIGKDSVEFDISIPSREDSMLNEQFSAANDAKQQRPVSYYDIGRYHRLLSRRKSGSPPRSEYQRRSVSNGSRLSAYGPIRQEAGGTNVADRSGNSVTHALRALKVRSVDMLHPKPTLRFEYEPIDNTVIPIDPFTSGDVQGLRRSQIRSLHVDEIVDDMNSHEIRVALERDARRSLDARRSISSSQNHTRPNFNPLDERSEMESHGARRPWPWRDSRELMDKDRERIVQRDSRRHSQTSGQHDEILQDAELSISNITEVCREDPYLNGATESTQSEDEFLPDEPTLISPQGLRYREVDMRTMDDCEQRRYSDAGLPRRGPKYDYTPSSGRVLTTAWASFLKRATAERIRQGIKVRETGGLSWGTQNQQESRPEENEFTRRESLSGDSVSSGERIELNDDREVQYISETPAAKAWESMYGSRTSPVRRRKQYEADIEHCDVSHEQYRHAYGGDNFVYNSRVGSRRAHFVRQEELHEGYEVEELN
ncbi:hypothetical protein POJ06DRAFT_299227 [Lipomyces tetrasporus]|uniref:Uncharacterized protein n=1 Tax=Lipomyces tetrasporus TaxID=54092 RepID=A0AAD7VW34_9ASCO|nr:uncharacterized protein POJ06DRAFT_299227 [Lipomyces tetrasporus]KAJ8102940.1 hypothetical protein POJ06DRAFT_299227 [Lipomyces tetrasporus]